MRNQRRLVIAGALVVSIANLAIAAKLFGVEHSAYRESVEGAFIANARVMAEHPNDWNWWPLWGAGMPIENTYLPLTQFAVASFQILTGFSPARSFHLVTAGFYVCGALTLYWMALVLTRKPLASLTAALAYSCFALSPVLLPAIRRDMESALDLRRLQALVYYGEAPHTIALVLLPVAVVGFFRVVTAPAARWKILAGLAAACIMLSNAFGAVALAMVLGCLLLTYPSTPWWKAPATFVALGAVSCAWISPWLSPGLLRAIRLNSPTAGGDYRFTAASWITLATLAGGFALLCWVLRRAHAPPHLRFFALFAYLPTSIVVPWHAWKVAVIAQPNRYHLEMEMALLLLLVFGAAEVVCRLPGGVRRAVTATVFLALAWQTVHAVRYARGLIREADADQLVEYRIAKWLDRNRHGERAFLSGSTSILYNVFTDNPQFFGAHEPLVPNPMIRIAAFTIYSGMNAGARDVEYSLLWLKAFGARAISVAGPNGREYYKPFANPRKFEGILPVIWREGDDTIYAVPSRSASLAHVIPDAAIPARTPKHGLDIGPIAPYVAALDDSRYPLATFEWQGMSAADIRATVERGQVIAVQVTYDRGWEAYAQGRPQRVRADAIGLMVIEPDRAGPCRIWLRYTGGQERVVTRALSLGALLAAAVFGWRNRRRW